MSSQAELLTILLRVRKAYFIENVYDEIVKNHFVKACDPKTMKMDLVSFSKYMQSKAQGLTEEQIKGLFRFFDKNSSGNVNFQEFKGVFTSIRYLTEEGIQLMQQQRDNNNRDAQKPININIDVFVKDITKKQDFLVEIPNQPARVVTYIPPNPMDNFEPIQKPQNHDQQLRNTNTLPPFNPLLDYPQQQQTFPVNSGNKYPQLPPKQNQQYQQQPYIPGQFQQQPQAQQQQQYVPTKNELNTISLLTGQQQQVQPTPAENPFDSVFVKLLQIKQLEESKKINLLESVNPNGDLRISLADLAQFLASKGAISFSPAELNALQDLMQIKSLERFYLKDFYQILGLKMKNPNSNNNQIQSNQGKQADLPPQPQQNLKNNNNNNQLLPQVSGKIDVMISCIQTKHLFEVEDSQLSGFSEFVERFKQVRNNNNTKELFNDPSFLAAPYSLQDNQQYPKNDWANLKWLRPKEIFDGKEFQMFTKIQSLATSRIGLGKLISPYDIMQGMLGDCYFLSAVSSLAIEPQRILNLFITRITNPYGIYCVKICHDGEWKVIYVDDQFPCYNSKPAFTKASSNEIWVLVLEKAWAKLFKSYAKIESGFSREALRDLTGAPTKLLHIQNEEEVNGKTVNVLNEEVPIIMKQALSKTNKFVVTAGAESSDILTKSTANRLGLVNSHAYSVIAMKEIEDRGKKETLVRLRNPWGKLEWKGDWSDNSPLWTPKLKAELRVVDSDNGIFYMSISDFQKYFCDVCICYYHDDFFYNSYQIPHSDKNHSKYFRFRIQEKGTYYVSIIQQNKRTFYDRKDYDYSTARLFLTQVLDQNGKQAIQYKGSLQKKDREIFIESYLQPGVYMMQTKVFWDSSVTSQYVASIYGEGKTTLELFEKTATFQSVIKECMLQRARTSSKLKPFKNEPSIIKANEFEIKEGFGYYYIKNDSKKTLDLTSNFTGTSGIKISKPLRLPSIQVVLPPGEDFVATVTVNRQGYSYKCSESFLLQ